LEILFPEKKVLMKPSDLFKFSIVCIIAVISVILQIETDPSFYVTILSILAFLSLSFKFYNDYRARMLSYESIISQSLYHKNMNNHVGLILYLLEQLKFQEFKEISIAFVFLLLKESQDVNTLDSLCEDYLANLLEKDKDIGIESILTSSKQKRIKEIDFECNDSLKKLEFFGLVSESHGIYTPVTLQEAIKKLDNIWKEGFLENQKDNFKV